MKDMAGVPGIIMGGLGETIGTMQAWKLLRPSSKTQSKMLLRFSSNMSFWGSKKAKSKKMWTEIYVKQESKGKNHGSLAQQGRQHTKQQGWHNDGSNIAYRGLDTKHYVSVLPTLVSWLYY